MIFGVQILTNPLIQNAYEEGMRELNDFWELGWKDNTPDIFVVETRKEIDQMAGKKTSGELVGWSKGRSVYVLNYQALEKESSYHLSEDQYKALIKHELNHLFHGIVSGGAMGPLWFKEGLSIYLSGQITYGQWEKPAEFRGFIESSKDNKKFAYTEGGYVIEFLIREFGKAKLIEFVKKIKKVKSDEDFKRTFVGVFGIELQYDLLNDLYKKPG